MNDRLKLRGFTNHDVSRLPHSYFNGRQRKRNTPGFAQNLIMIHPWESASKVEKFDQFVALSEAQQTSTPKVDSASNQLSSTSDNYLRTNTESSLSTSTETVNTTNSTQNFEVTQIIDLESDLASLGWQIKMFNYVKNFKFNQTWSSFNYTMANLFMNLVKSGDDQNWIKNNIWIILSCLLFFITMLALFMLCYQTTTLSEYFKWSKKSKRGYQV